MKRNTRILFLAEAVTLAHVARPLVLASAASDAGYETAIACDRRYQKFVDDGPWTTLPLHSIGTERFLNALAKGKPFYDEALLKQYVEEDLVLLRRIQPDLVVGDFRLSLSVSARLAKVPYASITNAYWSPYAAVKTLPLPVLPMTKALPLPVAGALFDVFSPLVTRLFVRPFGRLRKAYGLPALTPDLRVVYTDADHVLYADVPQMFATRPLPPHHRFIGPILWTPPVPPPAWWDSIGSSPKPVIYVTLGSSGPPELLSMVLDVLASMPVTVMASTAGAVTTARSAGNVYVADYLPGIEAAARSDLVICNGGSPTAQQALAAGVPVLGIASNMDQFLNMQAIVASGTGLLLRADRTSPAAIRSTVERMLASGVFAQAAGALARDFAAFDAGQAFCAFVDQVIANGGASADPGTP